MVEKTNTVQDGWGVMTLELPQYKEYIISVDFDNGVLSAQGLASRIKSMGVDVLGQFVLAGCEHYSPALKGMGFVDWPLTWVHGDACKGGEMHSSQILAISGLTTEAVFLDGKVAGRIYEDESARYCRLSGILPDDSLSSKEGQAISVFERIQSLLESVGMDFKDVVRTWLYLDELLTWYDDFNKVRTAFFTKHGVFDKLVPASTGIGAANPYDKAMMADVLAIVPKNSSCKVEAVVSPLQCPAISYRSSFSRAVEIRFPAYRQLLISGTASIDTEGHTVYIGDPVRQIERTMEVIEAILVSRGMGWDDLTRGIAYFKDMSYLPLYKDYCEKHQIPPFPLAVSHADVCRDDLLFELEVDAVKGTSILP